MLDFHNHLMPGVDDGARDIDESRIGLKTMVDQGIDKIITTPHIRGSITRRPSGLAAYLADTDAAFELLQTLAEAEFPSLVIERGVEMMLDIPSPFLDDPRLRLAGTSFALFEFPFMNIPPNSALAIRDVAAAGIHPIIAHPERYANMSTNLDMIESWVGAGALIQVNSGSLTGQYGNTARGLAWHILGKGWAHYLSSDYHSRGRCSVNECRTAMEERGGADQFKALTVTNPERILESQLPVGVKPLPEVQRGFWKKIFG